jgi:hypothetical protein
MAVYSLTGNARSPFHAEPAHYVHDNEQPTLIVKDVKSGANGHGGVALWLEPGTVAHFRNLTVEPSTR